MHNHRGISVDDLAWIQRDQFLHYMTVARAGHDPADWSTCRQALLDAISAAFGLDPDHRALRRAGDVLDTVRQIYDPTIMWPQFMEAVWGRRHAIRPDLTATARSDLPTRSHPGSRRSPP